MTEAARPSALNTERGTHDRGTHDERAPREQLPPTGRVVPKDELRRDPLQGRAEVKSIAPSQREVYDPERRTLGRAAVRSIAPSRREVYDPERRTLDRALHRGLDLSLDVGKFATLPTEAVKPDDRSIRIEVPLLGHTEHVGGVRVFRPDGSPFAGVSVRLVAPAGPHAGTEVTADRTGLVKVANAGRGWVVASAEYELVPRAKASLGFPAVELTPGPAPDPASHVDVPPFPFSFEEVVARRAMYLECPQCARTFKIVESAGGGGAGTRCPHDGFGLSTLEAAVAASPESFRAPLMWQVPSATPGTLRTRGTRRLISAHGPVTVYWDESRFLTPVGGDYRLWGDTTRGIKRIKVIGRTTWGAAPPIHIFTPKKGPPRTLTWEFHEAALGASAAYATIAVPRSENRPLATVFQWMTVHHTTDRGSASFATARSIQTKHQTNEKDPEPDIRYHFLIDTDGAVYEGRPLGIEGSHVPGFNAGNIGIVVAGDFESRKENLFSPDKPTAHQLRVLDDLVDVLADRFDVRSVWTHIERNKQAGAAKATECPGEHLIPHVDAVLRPRYPGPPP